MLEATWAASRSTTINRARSETLMRLSLALLGWAYGQLYCSS